MRLFPAPGAAVPLRAARPLSILLAAALTLGMLVSAPALLAQGKGKAKGKGKANPFADIDWNAPFPAHKIVGNLYFVGSKQLGTFLVTTPEGHILINSSFEETVPVIRKSVEDLGFQFSDIGIVLGSHAHGDHMSGDAMVKELTGARVMAMEQDVPALQAMRPGGKEHPIDRVLHDGDTVELGGVTLTAHLTAGHTKGCTTWTMQAEEGGERYDVAIVGSLSLNAAVLVNNAAYPQIADDYRRSFATMRSLPADVFVGSHTGFYQMTQKHARLAEGGPNPFVDPEGYRRLIDNAEQAFNNRMRELGAAN